MPSLLFCVFLGIVGLHHETTVHLFSVICNDFLLRYYHGIFTAVILLWFRYGGYSFGLVRDEIPENFGKNGPTQFRKLAVRHATLVSHSL